MEKPDWNCTHCFKSLTHKHRNERFTVGDILRCSHCGRYSMYGIYDKVPRILEPFFTTSLRPMGVYPAYNSSLAIHYDVSPQPRTEADEDNLKERIREYWKKLGIDEVLTK